MDGDRSVADGRDIFESELQRLVRVAFETGWDFRNEHMPNPECSMYAELEEAYRMFDEKIHELVVSHHDGAASDVGSQDEADEKGKVGNGVRSEDDLTEPSPYTIFICKGYTGEYNLAKCETLLEAKKISDICNRMLFIQGYGYTGHNIQKYRISVRDSKSRYVY